MPSASRSLFALATYLAAKAIAAKAAASPVGEEVIVLGGWSEDQFADQPGPFSR